MVTYENPNALTQPDESYWQALMVQGEFAPPCDPHELARALHFPDLGPPTAPDQEAVRLTQGAPEDWERAKEDLHQHRVLELRVSGCNKGGVLVDYHSIQGFVPTSHMLNLPRLPNADERVRMLSQKIGQTLRLRIIEIDLARSRLILSERAAQEDERALRLWQTVKPGDVLDGVITRLQHFGAFVDVGGVEGLIHVSELSWGRVDHPRDVVQPGDRVRVYVLAVKPNQRKMALSLKRLKPDPWAHVEERYQVGDIVEGVVTNVVDFGAFVRLEEGLEGLIHLSELANGHFLHPRNVVQEGQRVWVRVLQVDGKNRRLGLSLRQVPGSYF